MLIISIKYCPVCGGSRFATLPLPQTWIDHRAFAEVKHRVGLTRCRDCTFVFVNPRPGPALLNAFYSGTSYSCHRPSHSNASRKTAEFLVSHFAKHHRGS